MADSLWNIGLRDSQLSGDFQSEGQFLINLGKIRWAKRKYDEASNFFDSAFKIAKQIDDLNLLQLIEANLGNIGYIRGDYEIASENYKKARYSDTIIKVEPSLVE